MIRLPLSKEEVVKCIERKGCSRVPLVKHKWWGKGLLEVYGDRLTEMAAEYPDDILLVFYTAPGEDVSTNSNPSYRWGYKDCYEQADQHSIGEFRVLMPSWDEFDQYLKDLPDPMEPGNFDSVNESIQNAGDIYKLGGWWGLFHERFWLIRGMENLMIDYYENMDELKKLGRVLLDYYKVIIDRYAELGFDGIFTSDDLGHQTGPMMPPAVFEELYLPLYKEFISYVHSKKMHVILHSCGDNTKLMDFLVEAGLDVLHPLQAGCMDWELIAREYGGKMSFLAGVDVQHLLPEGTVQEVREGVRRMMDIFHKPEGGLLVAAGNGIMPGTPLVNIQAMLEEISVYKDFQEDPE